ncbi:MAG: transposase [Sediminibacterium sp.]
MDQRRKVIRYSESFKQQIISEYASGKSTISSLALRYGIKGGSTIKNWIQKSHNFDLLPKIIRVETPSDKDELASLRAENKKLKLLVADQALDLAIAQSTIEYIEKYEGVDLNNIKKKPGALLAHPLLKKGSK